MILFIQLIFTEHLLRFRRILGKFKQKEIKTVSWTSYRIEFEAKNEASGRGSFCIDKRKAALSKNSLTLNNVIF